MHKIRFFMDFLSPFTYFAWLNHQKLIPANSATFEYLPITMGTLFNHHEIKGPGLIPAKRLYVLKSCFRYAYRHQIKFIPPHTHPFNPLYCLRMATFEASGEYQKQVIDLFWKLIWEQGKVLEDPDIIVKELNKANLPGDEILERSFSKDVKQALKKNTRDAISLNAFGSPSFVSEDDELFWGNDSLGDLKNYLEDGDQINLDLFEQRTSDIKL